MSTKSLVLDLDAYDEVLITNLIENSAMRSKMNDRNYYYYN